MADGAAAPRLSVHLDFSETFGALAAYQAALAGQAPASNTSSAMTVPLGIQCGGAPGRVVPIAGKAFFDELFHRHELTSIQLRIISSPSSVRIDSG